jgi:two-component system NtrC family sensor kinase
LPDTKIKLSEETGPVSYEIIAAAADLARMGLLVTLISEESAPEILYLSPRVEQILGRTAEEIRAKTIWAFIAEEELPAILESYETRFQGIPPPERQETTVAAADGSRVRVEMFHSVVGMEGGRVAVTFVREISDRYAAEEELRRSEQRFRTLVENAPDGIAIIKGMQIAYLNRSGAALAGVDDPNAVIGVPVSEFVHSVDVKRIGERLQAVRESGHASITPSVYRTTDRTGRSRAIEALAVPIEYQGEEAVLAFIRDVTERIEMQNRLAQADRLTALGTLAAGLAHEINNPLTYVTVNLARIKKQLSDSRKRARAGETTGEQSPPGDTEKLLRMLDDAQQGVERVTRIVRDIQRFSRPPSEEKKAISLREALDNALAMAGHAVSHKVRIVCGYQDTPAVFGSPSRVERLFINLIINAAQSFDEGEAPDNRVEVSISSAPESAVVEIADNGCGMSPETTERIFDPFFTTKPAGEGTGLGLAICKSIADEMGGKIEVESEPGRGSRFRVILPAWEEKSAERVDPAAAERRRRISSSSFKVEEGGTPAQKAKIGKLLLIDDEPNVAYTLKEFLSTDFDVETFTCAADALEKLEAGGEFDAVLCDLAMPNMSGAEFYRKLNELDPVLADRTVLMTGMLGATLPDLLGPDIDCPLLQKPFDPEEARGVLVRLVKDELPASG